MDDDLKAALPTVEALMRTLSVMDTTDATDLLVAPLLVAGLAAQARGFDEDAFADHARQVFRAMQRQTTPPTIPTA